MTNKTILYFHTGRGGRFNNSGYISFQGKKNITQILNNSKRPTFLSKENLQEIYSDLQERDLTNLLQLLDESTDNNDYSRFEKVTGFNLGDDVYTDSNGNQIITLAEAETGVGQLNWDNDYDTDTCMFLSDCSEADLCLINNSSEYGKEDIIQDFFNDCTDLKIEWAKFNGNYDSLITDYFKFTVDVNDYYDVKEEEEAEA
jgi:hypothetical protein